MLRRNATRPHPLHVHALSRSVALPSKYQRLGMQRISFRRDAAEGETFQWTEGQSRLDAARLTPAKPHKHVTSLGRGAKIHV